MEVRSSRRGRTLVTRLAPGGLSANEIARALISMMARSPTRSTQRPDTLMQDRICQIDEISCNARPDHTLGQTEKSDRPPSRSVLPQNRTSTQSSLPSLVVRVRLTNSIRTVAGAKDSRTRAAA